MELGEKLRKARLEAGLTQKQLCEGVVTRNMLSQIENGSARPSVGTLTEFAKRLGKSVSFFLEEAAAVSPNAPVMTRARELFEQGSWAKALGALEQYREPDGVYDREKQLLAQLCTLELARQAIRDGREIYAGQLLESCPEEGSYCAQALRREKLLLLGKLPGERVSNLLPSLDEELLIRAGEAMKEKQSDRAAALLDACEQQGKPEWQLLRGRLWLEKGEYAKARDILLAARDRYPRETDPMLETCFRELGDYKSAYEYACRQRR